MGEVESLREINKWLRRFRCKTQ